MHGSSTSISFKNVSFTYRGNEKPSLRGINLEIGNGEFVLVTGPSGSGKSTLARLMTGLIPHSYPGELTGSAKVCGMDVKTTPIYQIAQNVGLVLQNPENQLFALTVEDDIAFGPENLRLSSAEIRERVEWSLGVTGLESERFRPPFELSGGLQQRAAIAGVLAMKPKVMILDEPASFMDPLTAYNFAKFLNSMRSELMMTIIIIEQKLELFYTMATRAIVMNDGEIVADATPIRVFDLCKSINMRLNFPVSYLFLRRFRMKSDIIYGQAIKDSRQYVQPFLEEMRKG